MKQIYLSTRVELDVEATLRELQNRVNALELQVAELHRAAADGA